MPYTTRGLLRAPLHSFPLVMLASSLLATAMPVHAGPTPAQQCQAGKSKAVGKYTACRLNAEAKLATSGDVTAYSRAISKCEAKFEAIWPVLEAKAVAKGGLCVTNVDLARIKGQVDHATTQTANFLGTGAGQDIRLYGLDLSDSRVYSGAEFTGANFTSTDLTGALLFGTNFTLGYLSNTILASADLTNANLTGAYLYAADLTAADLTAARLTDVIWQNTTCPDGTNSATNGSSPESCCAHLNGSVPTACSP